MRSGRRLFPMKRVIIDAVRTPVGRASADKGISATLRSQEPVRPYDSGYLNHCQHRPGSDRTRARQGQNPCSRGLRLTRHRADRPRRYGLPQETASVTIQCAAAKQACRRERRRDEHRRILRRRQIAGGVEHMEHPDDQGLQPVPGVLPAAGGDHEHGAHRRMLAAKYRIPPQPARRLRCIPPGSQGLRFRLRARSCRPGDATLGPRSC